MTEKVRVGVIGAGRQGRKHARVYRDIPGVELVAVADLCLEARGDVARLYGAHPYSDFVKMLENEELHAVSVCVPTVDHREVTLKAIERGLHVLVEKPIAFNSDEGRDMIRAARKAGCILMVGHNERFNPAVMELKKKLDAGELGQIYQIQSRRMGPFPPRTPESGVVINLAVHEIDIMHYLLDAEVVRVQSELERKIHSASEDLLTALLRFDDGTIGDMSINWLTPTNIRQLWLVGEKGIFNVNYLTQDLTFCEAIDMKRECQELPCPVVKKESIRTELEAFVAAIRGDEADAVPVTGDDGLKALLIAEAIIISGTEHRAVEMNS